MGVPYLMADPYRWVVKPAIAFSPVPKLEA